MDDIDAASEQTLDNPCTQSYRQATLCVHVPVERDPYGASSHPV